MPDEKSKVKTDPPNQPQSAKQTQLTNEQKGPKGLTEEQLKATGDRVITNIENAEGVQLQGQIQRDADNLRITNEKNKTVVEKTEKDILLERCAKVLKEHNGLESNIGVTHIYWEWLNRIRAIDKGSPEQKMG